MKNKFFILIMIFAIVCGMSVFAQENNVSQTKVKKSLENTTEENVEQPKTDLSDAEINYNNYVEGNDNAPFYDVDCDKCNHEHMEIYEYVEDGEDEWYEGKQAYCPSCGYTDNNYHNSRKTHKIMQNNNEED